MLTEIIKKSKLIAAGTPPHDYLAKLGLSPPPRGMKWLESHECYQRASNGEMLLMGKYPAIICPLRNIGSDEIVGLHTIHILPDRTTMRSDDKGGYIALCDCTDTLTITQSVESALLHDGWVTMDLSNFTPPEGIKNLLIIPDSGFANKRAAYECATKLTAIKVNVFHCEGKNMFVDVG